MVLAMGYGAGLKISTDRQGVGPEGPENGQYRWVLG